VAQWDVGDSYRDKALTLGNVHSLAAHIFAEYAVFMKSHLASLILSGATLLLAPALASANGLRVETVRTQVVTAGAERAVRVEARVQWQNSWRNARNHDAAWLFVKARGNPRSGWTHPRVLRIDPATPSSTCTITTDRIGAFCSTTAQQRGAADFNVVIYFDPSSFRAEDLTANTVEAMVVGIEMVYIPAGPFTIGDPDTALVGQAAFYESDAAGRHAGTFRITSEAELPVGGQPGSIYYKTGQYSGDGVGPIPAAFPKGTRAFYVMKYEILQGQYATFLNTLHEYAAAFRSPIGNPHYAEQRGSLRIENGRYIAGSPDRPANYTSWDDGLAFADWAGLRPWTELEFTKAARGPVEPVVNDFPWGTSSKERLLRRNQPNDELLQTGDADESKLTDATRDVFGASYFWVMDLAGSVWEKVVTIGHPRGRAFTGSHGDGKLADYGRATNDDWPHGDHEAGGYGYRGGGYYERGMRAGPLNPHSRVEQRPFGSWGGGPRAVAYGFRAARTADQ
jgi:formylglycine-generating enzyme required for sulfatase activity